MLFTSIFCFCHKVLYAIKEILHDLDYIEIIICKCFGLNVLGFNTTLTAKVISWRSLTHVSWLSDTSTNTTFRFKATDYFSHMLLQR